MRVLRLPAIAALVAVETGCAAGARLFLFSGSPEFVLLAEETADGVILTPQGLVAEDFEDDLCDSDDGDSCKDDFYVGLGFYRSNTGPYGEYEELGIVFDGEFIDTRRIRRDDVVAWRAGTLREEEEDDPRMDKVSIAAELPGEVSGTATALVRSVESP